MTNLASPRARGRRDWRPAFLNALESEGTVTAAAAIANVTRTTVYHERQRNEEFALAWADVEERVTEGLERKAVQMAMSGEVKLIEFLLKARRPERYRDNVKVEHSGAIKRDVQLVGINDEQDRREALRRLADAGALDDV
jgi:hypothetical protein